MKNICNHVNTLSRPKLLIKAARTGISEYRRDRDLTRVEGMTPHLKGNRLIETLLQEELQQNERRLNKQADYNLRLHVRLLTALLVEANKNTETKMAA